MATKTNSNVSAQRMLTGADLLDILNRKNPTTASGEATDALTNVIGGMSEGVSRLSAAFSIGTRNFGNHYALERAVQIQRSDERLRQAAERAAARMNAFIAS